MAHRAQRLFTWFCRVSIVWLSLAIGLVSPTTTENGWSRQGRTNRNKSISLRIALHQHRFDELDQVLLNVSDPFHTRHGQYLSIQEVNALITPSNECVGAVQRWLAINEIKENSLRWSEAKDWVTVETTIQAAEKLLSAEYHDYVHESTGQKASRAVEWSMPRHLHTHIDSIQPTDSFFRAVPLSTGLQDRESTFDTGVWPRAEYASRPAARSSSPANLGVHSHTAICNSSAVSADCVRAMYGTIDYKVRIPEKNTMALVNFDGEFNNISDIRAYMERYRPDLAGEGYQASFQAIDIGGATNQQMPADAEQLELKYGQEGNLDAISMLGIAAPTRLIAYSVKARAPPFLADSYHIENTNEPFLEWLLDILEDPSPPSVVAISYGDIEQTVPRAYANRVCRSFAQLGARGVSVIFGAGDYGVGRTGHCVSNDGSKKAEFWTSFPASCPYGTSVGATRGISPNEVVGYNDDNGFVTGGGFSKYFTRPAYQHASGVVDRYLSQPGVRKHEAMYNSAGRAYPDVASSGYRKTIVWNGTERQVDGTSASAPTFAGIIALLNDALMAEGKPVMGFLNPWLYTVGHEAFRDVTEGSTKGCSTDGLPAGSGWDAASGFGTPWFPDLLKLAMIRTSGRPWYWDAHQ